ncbi:hypothetical protein [Burkholderia sp. BCC1977]|uniref:hypothetical protein n=1 Tax=Burkholderia sp. BCC1977 TaxID=2817440 RepID=UPI002ABE5946|nr:hypothetical protein [Burkholderia sp. BCC1977]
MNAAILKIEDLTKEERAAIAKASILQPSVPDGHLYVYAADVRRLSEWYASRCVSLPCRLLRNILQFPDELCSGDFLRSLAREHKATTIFYLCVAAVGLFVAVCLFVKKDANPANFFEAFGTLALFFGAFWTATGVTLSARESQKLVSSDDQTLDHGEALKILASAARAASGRAWNGVFLLGLGTFLILVKILIAHDG